MAQDELPFWKRKKLSQMTLEEWESLCDGCAKCCLHKLEDIDSGEISYTNVACRLLDAKTCRCSNYVERTLMVPDCVELLPRNVGHLKWLPPTCAYRLIDEGKDLAWWHPLVSGDPDSVHKAGMSARGRVVPEQDARELEEYIVDWPGAPLPDEAPAKKTARRGK